MFDETKSAIQQVPIENSFGVALFMKREDLIHPDISGNKYRKLKYNIEAARQQNKTRLLTFGGAYSNHIAATAAAGKIFNLSTIGIIRGEELAMNYGNNPTLQYAENCGMTLHFVTRQEYRLKTSLSFIGGLQKEFGEFYLIPEGGTNALAVKGCEEILNKETEMYSHVCCAVGTGGTISGLVKGSNYGQQVLGFSSLKGPFTKDDIANFVIRDNWQIFSEYHFGGYAKVSEELIDFMNNFRLKYGILLDPIYTAKMMYGILDLINKNYFQSGSKILAIHTGGYNGIEGINNKLKNKNLPLIDV